MSSRQTPADREGWKKSWEVQRQPWRTEAEIDEERQKFLAERRAITPNIENADSGNDWLSADTVGKVK